MNAGLVRECAVPTKWSDSQLIWCGNERRGGIRYGVHERNVDFDGLRHQILNLAEHGEIIFGFDVFRVGSVEAGNESAERGDSNAFPDTKDSYVVISGV